MTGRRRSAGRALVVLLALAALAIGLWFWLMPSRPPNVVVITIESLRPDHLALFGGPRRTAPHLDRLGAESRVYTDAHAVTSWTLASHASLFTGTYPPVHGAVLPTSRLAERHETLAEALAARGYQCAAVVSGPYLNREHGLDQGFEIYDTSPVSEDHVQSHADVTSPAMEAGLARFLTEQRDPDRPFFLFAYFWDPHYDYIPPAPYDTRYVNETCEPVDVTRYLASPAVHEGMPPGQLAHVKSQYEGEIAWTDEHLGRVLALLREQGLWDDTLIVVTSDHGEEFFDHGSKGHKNNLYAESVHVPLVVKYPQGRFRGEDDRLVSLVDVMPTVLDVAGEGPRPPGLQGRSLQEPSPPDRAVYFDLISTWYGRRPEDGELAGRAEFWQALRRGPYKLIVRPDAGRLELYDESRDPQDRWDVSRRFEDRVQALKAELDRWRAEMDARSGEGEQAELDDEALERLRAIGYLR